MHKIFATAFLAIALASPAYAYSVKEIGTSGSDEKLMVAIPDDWHEAHNQNDGKGNSIREYVPARQTVKNWEEMITINTIRLGETPPKGAHTNFAAMTLNVFKKLLCKSVKGKPRLGMTPNEDVSYFGIACQIKPELKGKTGDIHTRNFEMLWGAVIQGTEGLYVVQRAWHTDDVAVLEEGSKRALEKEKELQEFALNAALLCEEGSQTRKCEAPPLTEVPSN